MSPSARLSPAVNDPTTAVQAIDRMVDLLATVAGRPDPAGWYVDDAGVVRLRCREPSLGRMIDLAFIEVIRYGADSPQVVRRLHAAFDVLSGVAHRRTRHDRRAPPRARSDPGSS